MFDNHGKIGRRAYLQLTSGTVAAASMPGLVGANDEMTTAQPTTNTEKIERLDTYLAEEDLEAVWFAQPDSFAWLTGASNVIERGVEGVAAVGYDGDGLTLITANDEAPRFREEVFGDDLPIVEFEWDAASLGEAVAEHSPTPAAADFDVPDFEQVTVGPLRQPLTDSDIVCV